MRDSLTICKDPESILNKTTSRQASCSQCGLVLGFLVHSSEDNDEASLNEKIILLLDNISIENCEDAHLGMGEMHGDFLLLFEFLEKTRSALEKTKRKLEEVRTYSFLAKELLLELRKLRKQEKLMRLNNKMDPKANKHHSFHMLETGKREKRRKPFGTKDLNRPEENQLPRHCQKKLKTEGKIVGNMSDGGTGLVV